MVGHARRNVRAWLSEFAGTAILVFASVVETRWVFGPGSPLAEALPGHTAKLVIIGGSTGVLLVLLILSPLGRSSGGHFADPSVDYGVIHSPPGWAAFAVFTAEAVLLVILMAIVIVVLSRPALAPWTPLVVCAVVGVLVVVGGQISGASFNPARQFGPLMFAREWRYFWPYVFGPLAGGVVLALAIRLFGITRPMWCSLCGKPPRDVPATRSA